ncbi:MAG TPA: C25 family cysteine peptidase [Clostridiales bacterium]|nr:C25 family cysteine peptidase [Clostridiales bacterium]
MKKVIFATVILLIFALSAQTVKTIGIDLENKFAIQKTGDFFNGKPVREITFSGKEINIFSENTGEPDIPWIAVNVSVPEGAEYLNAGIIRERTAVHEDILIKAVQQIVPVSFSGKVEYVDPDYSSLRDQYYPASDVKFAGTSKLSCYTIFNFLISPFEYDIRTGRLLEAKELTFVLTYRNGENKSSVSKWDDGDFYESVRDMVVNKDDVMKVPKRTGTKEDVQHLIITNSELSSAFQTLADHRTAKGIVSEVITTSDIYSGYSGATDQIKIKNCIKFYYENKGLKWVVLGGDDTVVPDQNTYGAVNGTDYEDYTIPTDLFYACFDDQFDWNATSDDKIGNTDDNADMAPEVYIGRIPARTSSDANGYIAKLIQYENNPPVDITEKFLMTGCELWGSVGSVSDGEAKSEKMWNDYIAGNWNGSKYRLYDTNTDFAGGSSYDLTNTNLQEQINAGYGFVHMATHGNQTIWGMESGSYYNSSNASSLTNTQCGIVVTIACITNAFDCDAAATSANCNGGPYMSDPCLSEGFLRNPNGGAVGFLGSSRYGWGSGATEDHGVSFQYNDQFFYRLFTTAGQTSETINRFGAVASMAKTDYIGASSSNGAYRWIMYTLNTMGDPALKLITAGELSCKIVSPSQGAMFDIGSVVTISANAADNVGKSIVNVSFYINDVLAVEDTSEPYSYEWDTHGLQTGSYNIKAVLTDNENNTIEDVVVVDLADLVSVDDFETGDFTKNPWIQSGDANWVIDSGTFYEGSYSSRSGVISDDENSIMSFSADFISDGNVFFYKKISSESGYDFLIFYIDGVEQGRWSGISDWSSAGYQVTAGTHVLKWEYSKDVYVSSGSDCAWVDNIELSGIASSAPDIPANITTGVSNGIITISWDEMPNAISYLIYSSDDPYGTFTYETAVSASSWQVGVSAGARKFYYVVSSSDALKTEKKHAEVIVVDKPVK